MNKILERWLKLQIAENPRERSQLVMLNIIGVFLFLASLAGLFTVLFFTQRLTPISSFAMASSLILLALLRSKYWQWANILYPTILMTMLTVQAYYNDGLYDEMVFGFFVVIAISGLLLRRRGITAFTVISVLSIIGLGYAHMSGRIPKYDGIFEAQRIYLLGIMVALGGALLYLVINNLVATIDQLSSNEGILESNNQELRLIRESLEKQVTERTAVAEAARAEAELARQEAEAQAWFTRGQAQLAEKMRGEQSVEALAGNVTSYLCQYLGAHTGALFLVFGGRLKLTGRYAYTEHKDLRDEFSFGENLVGETAKTGQIIRVSSIPNDAMLVSSALGDAKPNQLLIAPIEANGQVFGVVELATLNQFSAEHEAFLIRVSESIVIALRTAQTRVQIDELLARSQKQAEELQMQEEELRAANEELQAKAENLKARKNYV